MKRDSSGIYVKLNHDETGRAVMLSNFVIVNPELFYIFSP